MKYLKIWSNKNKTFEYFYVNTFIQIGKYLTKQLGTYVDMR